MNPERLKQEPNFELVSPAEQWYEAYQGSDSLLSSPEIRYEIQTGDKTKEQIKDEAKKLLDKQMELAGKLGIQFATHEGKGGYLVENVDVFIDTLKDLQQRGKNNIIRLLLSEYADGLVIFKDDADILMDQMDIIKKISETVDQKHWSGSLRRMYEYNKNGALSDGLRSMEFGGVLMEAGDFCSIERLHEILEDIFSFVDDIKNKKEGSRKVGIELLQWFKRMVNLNVEDYFFEENTDEEKEYAGDIKKINFQIESKILELQNF